MQKLQGTIVFTVKDNHPDIKYMKDKNEVLTYSDVYTLDMDNFISYDYMLEYIYNDIKTVANGGYVGGSAYINIISLDIKKL